jgi:2,3-bisphosphoglycerate-independent phosphoglycerate mutase
VYRGLQYIDVAIRDGSFQQNKALLNSLADVKSNDKALHPLKLVRNGGVHSHIYHVKASVDLCKAERLSRVGVPARTVG